MPSAGLEPAISVSERPRTDALDRCATGTGMNEHLHKTRPVQLASLTSVQINNGVMQNQIKAGPTGRAV